MGTDTLRKAAAFIKKDFLVESSYRFSFLSNIFGIFISVLSFFFIDKLFGRRMAGDLEEFGVHYFSYVLLAMAFFSYIGTGLGSFSERIRGEQMQGTLEAIMLAPCRISTILFSIALWNLIFATFNMLVYIFLGAFLFKIDFTHLNILSALITLILTVCSFSGLGIISASFIIVWKRGNPLNWLMSSLEGLLGGVYFPVAVLPGWLQIVAHCLPITYAIRAFELSMYKGYAPAQLTREMAALFLFSIVLLPASIALFRFSLDKARKNGSLTQY